MSAVHANVGDWLLLHQRSDHHGLRRAQITDVHSPDGSPPYVVRWLDSGATTVIFPGADATVLTPEEQARIDEQEESRVEAVQRAISGGAGKASTRR